jgi:hypothetical protein
VIREASGLREEDAVKTDLTKLYDALTKHVRIGSFPVAVRMVKPGEQLPERVKRPAQDLKIKVATCQAISMARRYGWVVAVGDEDISCPLTAVVFGFRKASDFYMKGQACAGMYTALRRAGCKILLRRIQVHPGGAAASDHLRTGSDHYLCQPSANTKTFSGSAVEIRWEVDLKFRGAD